MCGLVRVGGGNLKSVWWNDQVKSAVKRKEDGWKEVLGARDEDVRESLQRGKEREVKRCIYYSRKEVQEQFGRKMNQDVNRNRKLFWKEVNKVNRGTGENFKRIKDGNGRLILEEVEVRRIWKEYYEALYPNFVGVWRGSYFGREPIRRTEVEVRVEKLKNRKKRIE